MYQNVSKNGTNITSNNTRWLIINEKSAHILQDEPIL